jgi:Transposase DDE domain
MTSWKIPAVLSTAITRLSLLLDARLHDMFQLVFIGVFLTRDRRRTATSWFRAVRIGVAFRRAYRSVHAVGLKAEAMATRLLLDLERSPATATDDRLTFTLDDTPTQRYGPEVEGAGVHHNPTPGPSRQAFVYGHVWVTLARLVHHPAWGAISLPIRAELYVRAKDVPKIPKERRWEFRTKLAHAAGLMDWLGRWLNHKGKPLWLVADGAYAAREVLQAARRNHITVVSRLRKDAALRSLPVPPPAGQRGRKPTYGKATLSLAKRAGHPQGWVTEDMVLYGAVVTKTYKSFLATWPPAGGVVRVVLVTEDDGDWRAYFCTDPNATPAEILEQVADRNSLEQAFKDVKEIWGAGQQQLRNLHANLGAWHLNLWAYTLVELWAWEQSERTLVDRRASPWDHEPRRPSHRDRRKALLAECLREEFRAAQTGCGQKRKLRDLAERLLELAA